MPPPAPPGRDGDCGVEGRVLGLPPDGLNPEIPPPAPPGRLGVLGRDGRLGREATPGREALPIDGRLTLCDPPPLGRDMPPLGRDIPPLGRDIPPPPPP